MLSQRRAAVLVCVLALVSLTSAAVVGIDFGSEFIKVALVKPGTPFHIVVDEQSKRKIPAVIAFDEAERMFGNNALGFTTKIPQSTFMWAHRLLGKTIDSPQVKDMQKAGYPFEFVSIPERNSVGILAKKGQGDVPDTIYSAEELVAMSLEHVYRLADADAEGSPVKDCVITVPPFWTQKERRAALDAAELAGFNVLSLVNENTAAAIQYGIDRKYNVTDAPHVVVFYNMGSTSTKATLAVFSAYPGKKVKKTDSAVGQVEIKGNGYDVSLGGDSFDERIVQWMASEFNKKLDAKGLKHDIKTNAKGMAKLRKSAVKAKEVLSANQGTPIFGESLYNDLDLKEFLTREKFYELSADLLDRAVQPLQSAIEGAGLTPRDIDSVIIIGGSTRIPEIQKRLKEYLKRDELGMNLNGDEAMVMGAVFRAANLSTTFQVRKFGVVDITLFPVGVRLAELPGYSGPVATTNAVEEAVVADEAEEDTSAAEGTADKVAEPATGAKAFSKRAALFNKLNRLAKRKTVAFTHTRDFSCTLHHDFPELLPAGQTTAIMAYNVTGLSDLVSDEKNAALLLEQKPKVSISFSLDSSGLVELVKAEATLEEMVKVFAKPKTPEKVNVTESTGDAAGSGSSSGEKTEGEADADKAKDASDASEKPEKEAEGDKEDKAEKSDKAEGEKVEEKADAEKAEVTETKLDAETVEPEFTLKKKVHRFPLKITSAGIEGHVQFMTSKQIKASRAMLAKLTKQDESKREIAETKNRFESFIYDTRGKLSDDEVTAVSTEEQREALLAALTAAEEWMFEQDDKTEAATFAAKLKELEGMWDPIAFRMKEVLELPNALAASDKLINMTRDLLEKLAKERPWITEEEREKLATMLKELEEWLAEKKKAQETTPAHAEPVLQSEAILLKLRPVAKLSGELLRRPKPKEEKPKEDKKSKGKGKDKKEGEKAAPGDSADDASDDATDDAPSTATPQEEVPQGEAATEEGSTSSTPKSETLKEEL